MILSSRDIPEQPKGKLYTGGVQAVLLCGYELLCLKEESVRRLATGHIKQVGEMHRVAML